MSCRVVARRGTAGHAVHATSCACTASARGRVRAGIGSSEAGPCHLVDVRQRVIAQDLLRRKVRARIMPAVRAHGIGRVAVACRPNAMAKSTPTSQSRPRPYSLSLWVHTGAPHSLTTTMMRLPLSALTRMRIAPLVRPSVVYMLECGRLLTLVETLDRMQVRPREPESSRKDRHEVVEQIDRAQPEHHASGLRGAPGPGVVAERGGGFGVVRQQRGCRPVRQHSPQTKPRCPSALSAPSIASTPA